MERKTRTALIAVICVLTAILLTGYKFWKTNYTSTYLTNWDESSYSITAVKLNETIHQAYTLSEGTTVGADRVLQDGSLNVYILNEQGDVLLREEEQVSGSYAYEIPEDGLYYLAVRGIKGIGTVEFTIEQK